MTANEPSIEELKEEIAELEKLAQEIWKAGRGIEAVLLQELAEDLRKRLKERNEL